MSCSDITNGLVMPGMSRAYLYTDPPKMLGKAATMVPTECHGALESLHVTIHVLAPWGLS